MTQPSPTDQQHSTPYPLDYTGTPRNQGARRGLSGWWIGLLALLPIACCGLPLLLAAGVTVGSGAVLGGVAGAVLMLLGATVLGVWGMRRGAHSTRPADTPRPPHRTATDAGDATLSTEPQRPRVSPAPRGAQVTPPET